MNKYFIFITSDRYPSADAGAIRTHSFALICKELGYKPFVIGMGEYTGKQNRIYDGVEYCSLRLKSASLIARIIGRKLFPISVIARLKKIKPGEIVGIMTVIGNGKLLAYLKKYSHKNNISVLFDSVEWYSPSEFKRGEKDYFFKANDNLNRYLIEKPLKVVGISRYLTVYFSSKGIDTIRIPVILDVDKIPFTIYKKTDSVIQIVYAGMPGNKDHLFELIEAVSLLTDEEQQRLRVRVIGIDKDTFINKWWKNRGILLSPSIVFEGRRTRDYVLNALNDADFAFLLRPSEERYAKAGFPTKVAESCSCGTALFCNYSSDLELYLHDGENSVIIDDCSTVACADALKRLFSLGDKKITDMKKNARLTAEKYYNWKSYIRDLESLMDDNL